MMSLPVRLFSAPHPHQKNAVQLWLSVVRLCSVAEGSCSVAWRSVTAAAACSIAVQAAPWQCQRCIGKDCAVVLRSSELADSSLCSVAAAPSATKQRSLALADSALCFVAAAVSHMGVEELACEAELECASLERTWQGSTCHECYLSDVEEIGAVWYVLWMVLRMSCYSDDNCMHMRFFFSTARVDQVRVDLVLCSRTRLSKARRRVATWRVQCRGEVAELAPPTHRQHGVAHCLFAVYGLCKCSVAALA